MANDNLAQRIGNLYKQIEDLRMKCFKDPEKDLAVLSDTLEELQANLKDLSSTEEFRRSEERFHSLAMSAFESVVVSEDGRIVEANEQFARLHGYELPEVIGRPVTDLLAPQEHEHVKNAIKSGKETVDEYIALNKDGSTFPIEAHGHLVERNGKRVRIAIIRDITGRKQIEEALQKSERKYRSIVEQSRDGITLVDENGYFIEWNHGMEDITGLKRDDVLGRYAWDVQFSLAPSELRTPEVYENLRALATDALMTGKAPFLGKLGETTVERPDGIRITIEEMTTIIPTEKGHMICGILRDITDRKSAEKSLQESEERFRRLFEDDLTGDFIASPDGQILICNPAFVNIFGFSSREEAIGSNLADIHILSNGHTDLVRLLYEHKVLNRYECDCQRRDGSTIHIVANLVGIFNELGELIQFKGYIFDDTERKRAEEVLRESELKARMSAVKLATTIDSVADGIVIYDKNGRPIMINKSAGRIFRLNGKEVIETSREYVARAPWFFADGTRITPENNIIDRALAGEVIRDLDITNGNDTPEQIWISGSAVPLRDETGEILGAVSSFKDITERKRMEGELLKSRDELELRVQKRTAELLKAKEAAEAATQSKAAFLANMSHELRTPMNAVIGFASLLMNEGVSPEQKEFVEGIRKGGEAMLALINDILDFSRVEKDKVMLEYQPFSLKHCIEESLNLVSAQSNKKGLNLAYSFKYDTPDAIMGDYGRLRQVLVNLLSNAIKFTDRGEISISISSKRLETANKYQIIFEILDTGIGIPQDKMDELFKPFSQVETALSRKRDGVGLGLAISKKLVELMGGVIWAKSEVGKGSTFYFTIEADIAQGSLIKSDVPIRFVENLAEQHPLRILVAEDNPLNQAVLVAMLKKMGYRPDMAANGLEVLQALERQTYDLVLMDVEMPEMDGIEATKEIRQLWPNDGPKIIAITAYALKGDTERCLEAGMDGYIAKPVKIGDLAGILKRCIKEIQ